MLLAALSTLCASNPLLAQTRPAVPNHDIEPLLEVVGKADDALSLPSDVAIDMSIDDGRIYVVDGGKHRVLVFDEQGRYLFQFGGLGSKPGQLQAPVGIGIGPNSKVYVADTGNRRIQIFDAHGKYLHGFAVKQEGRAVRPIDVAVDPSSHELYVTGNNNHQVMVFSSDGQLLRHWGSNGSNEGQFRYPATISMVPDGRIAVVDVLNTRVQIFESSGTFSAALGGWGVLPGELFRPKGVAVDSMGRYFVSDSYLNQVQVYDDTGVFMYVLSIAGKRDAFRTPVGMAIDARARLYVTQMLENKVSVFQFRP